MAARTGWPQRSAPTPSQSQEQPGQQPHPEHPLQWSSQPRPRQRHPDSGEAEAKAREFVTDRNGGVKVDEVHPLNPMTEPTSRFGFVEFAETWNGRLAMLGFVIGLGTELLTGQGILTQIGLG